MSAAIYPSAPSTSSITPIAPAFVNPAQMQNAQAGPSSPPSNKKKPPQPAKRKRTDTPEDDTAESATSPRKARDGPKKKKANRACFHCQKAHLTCDDSRPCQRCIKRGIANNCTEGHRKKAKYLLDDDELEQLKRKSTSTSASASEPPPAPPASSLSADPFPQNDPLLSNSFDPNFAFDSEVAGLEYSILSAILGNPSPPDSETSPPPQHQPYTSWSSDVDFTTSPKLSSYASSYSDTQLSSLPLKSTSSGGAPYLAYGYTQQRSEDIELQYQSQYSSDQPPESPHPLQPRFPLDSRARSPPGDAYIPGKDTVTTNTGLLSPAPSNASPTTTTSVPLAVADLSVPSRSKLQSINDRVTQPYDYTEGYHFLMKHLPNRFEKDDILRIVRALAIFRPSLIALQMPLSRDDEIFVEKCFQRTLLEMEKLISFSGTPTVVWRRTGEICLVAPEFCMLTDWPIEELVGRKKYIYELFENQSVVEYWENFATHAFENTTQAVYSHCVLLKPNGAPVPSSFCFSVRRDLFDLPSMVIGQWLPLL